MRTFTIRFSTRLTALLVSAGALAFVLSLPAHTVDAGGMRMDAASAVQPAERC